MSLKKRKPLTPGQRFATRLKRRGLTKAGPEKRLTKAIKKTGGRDTKGRVSIRHRGGGHKRRQRLIDFRREKFGIPASVVALEYDPNRGADIALVSYADGEKRYILAPEGLKVGDKIVSGPKASLKIGHTLPLKKVPVGTTVHNVELTPGKGGQMVRGAGTGAILQSKEGKFAILKLPSKEERKVLLDCLATIGQVSRPEKKTLKLGKAGRKRWLGVRPTVRGVAQHPGSHPHGGGEGRSGVGMPSPKSPWGKRTLGKKTRPRKKYSDKMIIKERK